MQRQKEIKNDNDKLSKEILTSTQKDMSIRTYDKSEVIKLSQELRKTKKPRPSTAGFKKPGLPSTGSIEGCEDGVIVKYDSSENTMNLVNVNRGSESNAYG